MQAVTEEQYEASPATCYLEVCRQASCRWLRGQEAWGGQDGQPMGAIGLPAVCKCSGRTRHLACMPCACLTACLLFAGPCLQGPYLGFRSAAAGGRMLQPRKKGPQRLLLASKLFGIWEMWEAMQPGELQRAQLMAACAACCGPSAIHRLTAPHNAVLANPGHTAALICAQQGTC